MQEQSRWKGRRSSIIADRSGRSSISSPTSASFSKPDKDSGMAVSGEADETVLLDFYYCVVKRTIMRYQSPMNGLFPTNSKDKSVGHVRDTIYCCMAVWSLHLGYKKLDDSEGRAFELGQSAVLGLQGVLRCWMRQAALLEQFKSNQKPIHALHVLFDMDTSEEVISVHKHNHLQVDIVALFLIFLVQAVASGLNVVQSVDEVSFIQNLVYYVERAYRTPDYGMWEIGSTCNNGTCEINASSIGMAKAALEAIDGFNVLGKDGLPMAAILVDTDAHNRNRMILESLLPKESPSKLVDASLLFTISFPAFATHNEALYNKTKLAVVNKLKGNYGFKRFSRDGYGTAIEPESRFYPKGKIPDFENIECEWPMLFAEMIIDGVFMGKEDQVAMYQELLKKQLCYTDLGDPLMPKYYCVKEDCIEDEKKEPGSQIRFSSKEGSSISEVFLWGQSLLIIADLLTNRLVLYYELDPICRHLASNIRIHREDRFAFGHSTKSHLSSNAGAMVQTVLICESRQLQASLNTFGIQAQTPSEIEPVQVWSQWDMVKVLHHWGENSKLSLTGRPKRPIGTLGTSKLYRVFEQIVVCYPLTFSATDFYLSHDLAIMIEDIRSDLKFVSQRWRVAGKRPVYCIVITEAHLRDPQCMEFLNLLCDLRTGLIDGVKIKMGKLQNLMTVADIQTLNCDELPNRATLDIKPFQQVQQKFFGFNVMAMPKVRPKVEEIRDFVPDFKDKSSAELSKVIESSDHLYMKIQLLGILLKRHGADYEFGQRSVRKRLEQLNGEASALRYWCAIRYSSSLLKQLVDSISPSVTQILVNGKQVTVGTICEKFSLFHRPLTPAEIHEAIYSSVQQYDIIAAVLQQELLIFCGTLINTNPELFDGILKVRIGWILLAVKIYYEITTGAPRSEADFIENLSPSEIRRLLRQVLVESRVIHFTYDVSNPGKSFALDQSETKLTVYQARQINGCLIRAPIKFYEDVWFILKKCHGGIRIKDRLLEHEPTISLMRSSDEPFAHMVENMLNYFQEPVYKQIVIEMFCVVSTILKRHPELLINEVLNVEAMITDAIKMYSKEKCCNSVEEARKSFLHEAVVTTSVFLAKATINHILSDVNLTRCVEKSATSEYCCPVQ